MCRKEAAEAQRNAETAEVQRFGGSAATERCQSSRVPEHTDLTLTLRPEAIRPK